MLSYFNVTKKLLVVFFVPVIVVLIVTWNNFDSADRHKQSYHSFVQLLSIAYGASDFIHELQKERGTSAIYIGSDGKQFLNELKAQQQATDVTRNRLQQLIAENKSVTVIKGLDSRFSELFQWVENLSSHRPAVLDLSVSTTQSFEFYTQVNDVLIQFITKLFLQVPDIESVLLFKGLLHFIEAKEQAGQERALMSKIFSSESLTADNYQKLVALVVSQKLAFSHFLETATQAQKKDYHDRVDEMIELNVDEMRRKVLNRFNYKSQIAKLEALFGIGGLWYHESGSDKQLQLMAKTRSTISMLQTLQGLNEQQEKALVDIALILESYPDSDLSALQNAMQELRNRQFGVSAGDWFRAASKRVNALRAIEKSIAADIQNHLDELIEQAEQQINNQIYLWIGLVLLIGSFYRTVLSRLLVYIHRINEGVTLFSKGELEHRIVVEGKDEFSNMANTFNSMAERLAQSILSMEADNANLDLIIADATEKLEQQNSEMVTQNWVSEGRAKLSDVIRQDIDSQSLFEQILVFMCEYLDCEVGAFYEACDKESLLLRSAHGISINETFAKEIKIGEGLVGKIAKQSETVKISREKLQGFEIDIGLGKVEPACMIYLPIYIKQHLLGVMVFCAMTEPSKHCKQFILPAKEQISVAIEMSKSRAQMKLLLRETQSQSQELQDRQQALTKSHDLLSQKSVILEQQKQDIAVKNKKIELANEELKEASRYKSEFLASMSHELRTPLNSMLVLSQKLSENNDNHLREKEVGYAQVIHRAGSDLLMLINEILDVSKIESGKFDVMITKVSLQQILAEVQATHAQAAQEKGLKLVCDSAAIAGMKISTDSMKVKQILHNFISNALKFTDKGEVEIKTQQLEESGKHFIRLAVKDTGKGIAKDRVSAMFEMFSQEDNSISRQFGGSGLGLYLCAKLAELIDASIDVHSEVGQGSEFAILLPMVLPEKVSIKDQTKPSVTTEQPQTKNAMQTASLTAKEPKTESAIVKTSEKTNSCRYDEVTAILLGNNARNLMQLKGIFGDFGIKSLVAPNLDVVQSKVASGFNAELVVVDIDHQQNKTSMPSLISIQETLKLPVLVLQADSNDELGKVEGMKVLTKPVASDALTDALEQILEQEKEQKLSLQQTGV